ncbi:universal stress protein [Streptomyces sp. NBC_01217]|uniref:universal stress protein n=1 Tax=Streptomyces sp. NBC_01217 TaxID=2903779 RepID=UPI002E114BF5|nr:universal stress protein [Streptomyces sp. NBC_01217]
MQFPVVVGVDGSMGSLRALDWAAQEAARSRLPLRVVHASLWERYEGMRPTFDTERPAEQILAEHLVASAQERAHRLHAEVSVVADIQPEDPVNALVHESQEAALVVVGSRGRGRIAGMLLGSVGLALAGRSRCPVVVVPATVPDVQPKPGRVVVGIGDAPGPSAAARFAFDRAASRHGELVAVRAWRCPVHETADHPLLADSPASAHRQRAEEHLENVLAVLERTGAEAAVQRSVVQGPVHQILIEAAVGAELLVVGAHRAGGPRGLLIGPVNHAVLHYAPCPVAVVPDTR